jgi:hypothetical protein
VLTHVDTYGIKVYLEVGKELVYGTLGSKESYVEDGVDVGLEDGRALVRELERVVARDELDGRKYVLHRKFSVVL